MLRGEGVCIHRRENPSSLVKLYPHRLRGCSQTPCLHFSLSFSMKTSLFAHLGLLDAAMNPELIVVMGEVALKIRVRCSHWWYYFFSYVHWTTFFVSNSRTSFYELFSITVDAWYVELKRKFKFSRKWTAVLKRYVTNFIPFFDPDPHVQYNHVKPF